MQKDVELNSWFIKLRWIAAFVAFVIITITVKFLHYLENDNYIILLFLIVGLVLINLIYWYIIKREIEVKYLTEIQIIIDLLILTILLHFSGGIENPLSFTYLFHVILSGILLSKKKSYLVVLFAFTLYFSLAMCELYEVLPHYTLKIFPHQQEHQHQLDENNHIKPEEEHEHASHYEPYVWSLVTLNFFMMLLTAYFITNIMERLRSEERKSKFERQRLERVLYSTNTGFITLDKEMNVIWYNETVSDLLNLKRLSRIEVKGKIQNWLEDHREKIKGTFSAQKITTFEKDYLKGDDEKIYLMISLAPLFDDDGEVSQIVEVIQDITIRKMIEAEMVHTAKMVTLGTMAAGIAHEVGNPLASISTRLELLKVNKDEGYINKSVELLGREINRIDRIVRGISQFGKSNIDERKSCDLKSILTETVELLKYHKVGKISEIKTKISGNQITKAVPDQIKQVFLNLGLNALEEMNEGGDLFIRLYNDRGLIIIEFEDTGKGIPEESIKKIFNPFYTTKENGSGLGLFIVKQIIEAHGGEIEVNSRFGEGSKFIVKLPIIK